MNSEKVHYISQIIGLLFLELLLNDHHKLIKNRFFCYPPQPIGFNKQTQILRFRTTRPESGQDRHFMNKFIKWSYARFMIKDHKTELQVLSKSLWLADLHLISKSVEMVANFHLRWNDITSYGFKSHLLQLQWPSEWRVPRTTAVLSSPPDHPLRVKKGIPYQIRGGEKVLSNL